MKQDLTKTSIIIHFRKDFEDRVFNLKTICNYFEQYFDYKEIIVINDDKELDPAMRTLKEISPKIKGLFYENDGVYRRTSVFNLASEVAQGEVLAFYDLDVLVDAKYLAQAQSLIVNGEVDHVYPFNGEFITVKKEIFGDFLPTYNFKFLMESKDKETVELASSNSCGGCNFISKVAFNRMGRYDDRFIGWGWEDVDYIRRSSRVNRVQHIKEPDAICWHLQHDNAIKGENPYYNHNASIFQENMNKLYASH